MIRHLKIGEVADYTKLSDSELVVLFKEGDEMAFSEVFKRYNSLLYSYAYRKLQDKEEAQDVVQEVYVTLWNTKGDFQLLTSLPAYLYRSVLNKILSLFRHKKIIWAYIDSFKESMELNTSSTDYMIREKEISKTIEQEINALPEKMRKVFQLRHQSHFSNKEIANILSLSEHTVATQMKKALKTLRTKLGLTIYLTCLIHLFNK